MLRLSSYATGYRWSCLLLILGFHLPTFLKGRRWGVELAQRLESTNGGILCVTPENVREPWLIFEAGALSKSVKDGQIHPLLFGMKSGELQGPLSQFQATAVSKEEIGKLVRDLDEAAGEKKLSAERIEKAFATCWPELDRKLSALGSPEGQSKEPTEEGKAQPAITTNLDDVQITILKLVAEAEETRLFPKTAAQVIGIHQERAKHILETLQAAGLLTASHKA